MFLRRYETVTIVDPGTGPDGLDRALERMRSAIEATSGREVRLEDWGRRTLAYPLGHTKKGRYLYLQYLGTNTTVSELERLLGITESVLKFQTIFLEDRVVRGDFDFDGARDANSPLAKKSLITGTSMGEPDPEPEPEEIPAEETPAEASAEEATTEEAAEEAAADEAAADEAPADEAPAEEAAARGRC